MPTLAGCRRRQAHDLAALLAGDCGVRRRLAAVRPPAVGGVLQRHHRPAQAHRARPRRRRARGAEGGALHIDLGPSVDARRPLPLVHQHRLDDVELPGRRRCSAAPPSASSTAAPAGRAGAPDWARSGALPGWRGVHLLRRRRGLLCRLPEGRRRAAGRADLGAARARLHRLAAVGRLLPLDLASSCHRSTARTSGSTPISGGTDFAGAFVGGLPTLPVVAGEMQCRCLGAAVEAWSTEPGRGSR